MKRILIVGMGCSKCETLAKNAEQAANELGLEYEIETITDLKVIKQFGLFMMTPALCVDGQIMATQKSLSVDEIKRMLIQ